MGALRSAAEQMQNNLVGDREIMSRNYIAGGGNTNSPVPLPNVDFSVKTPGTESGASADPEFRTNTSDPSFNPQISFGGPQVSASAPASNTPSITTSTPASTSVQDLYPEKQTAVTPDVPVVADPAAALTATGDKSVAEVDASTTELTAEQQVDKELERILGKDSPLLARARARATRFANQRGLQNTSIAAGMAQGEMVDAALPMAQQNAAQASRREMANTQLQQRADELTAQMQTAMEQQDADAYNRAQTQLAQLQRDADAQQSQLDFAAEQQGAAAQNRQNEQRMDQITRLNEQYLRGSQSMDLATIQGNYQQIISTNQTAGNLYQSYFSGISSVMADPKMTPSQIASAVGNMQRMLEGSLRMIEGINKTDFGDIGATVPGGSASDTPQMGPRAPTPIEIKAQEDRKVKEAEEERRQRLIRTLSSANRVFRRV